MKSNLWRLCGFRSLAELSQDCMVCIYQNCSKYGAPKALSSLCKHPPLREDRHPALTEMGMSFSSWGVPPKATAQKSALATRWHHGKFHVAVSWRWGVLQQRLKFAKMLRRPGRGNDNKQGRLAERKAQLSTVLPLACFMSEGYIQKAYSSVWRPRSLLWALWDSVQTREGLDPGAETQRQIEVLGWEFIVFQAIGEKIPFMKW